MGLIQPSPRWYFDVVSASTDASVTVVFYNGGPDGFINTYKGGPLSVQLSGTFANGTIFEIPAVPASSAIIDHGPHQNISVEYVDSGFSFAGTSVDEPAHRVEYIVTIDSPAIGVKGSIIMHSVSTEAAAQPFLWPATKSRRLAC